MQKPALTLPQPSRRALLTGRISSRPGIAVIGGNCMARHGIVCRGCGEACETGAIRFQLAIGSAGLPMIDNNVCTGCGDCVSICPASAIAIMPAAAGAAS